MAARQHCGQNEQVPPPPLLAPTVQELMAQQNEILWQLLQRQPHPQQYGGGQPQPPLFTKAEDPLDADVWLRVVESKFPLLTGACPDDVKTRFAAKQFCGPARTWWDHFHAMLPADHEVTWEEFKTAFRGHHIPAGIQDRKLNEFLALTQGTHTVLQYAQAFNNLCQYAGYHADSNEKKRDRFRRGLNTKLREHLNIVPADSFNELVNLAISQKDCIIAHRAEKKRKAPISGPSAPPQRFRIVSNSQGRGFQQQTGIWIIRPPQQPQAPNRFLAPVPRNNQPPQQQQFRQGNGNKCFTCGNVGHYAKNFPRNQSRQMQAPNQDRRRKQKVQVRQGKLNFTTLEELPEGASVRTGTFLVFNQPALILFDSSASHSFISHKFSVKCQLPFYHTQGSFMIATPRGKIATNQLNRCVPIQLGSNIVKTTLLILGMDNVDIILGANWMTRHQVVLDVANHIIEIHFPVCGKFTLFLPSQETIRSCAFAMIELPLKKIPVVCEYADVFPDELSGIPVLDVRQGLYPPKYFTLGMSSLVREEEG
jgi:hypothetical protein